MPVRRLTGLLIASVVVASVLAWPATASAEIAWTVSKKQGRAYLQGMPTEPEVDIELWAHCRADGAIDVGMGAESHVGKGKGERVALTLTSGGQSATIAGVSRISVNAEMTGGVELRARISRDDKLFAILATGQPIRVSGPIKPLKWDVKGLKARTAEFLKACKP